MGIHRMGMAEIYCMGRIAHRANGTPINKKPAKCKMKGLALDLKDSPDGAKGGGWLGPPHRRCPNRRRQPDPRSGPNQACPADYA